MNRSIIRYLSIFLIALIAFHFSPSIQAATVEIDGEMYDIVDDIQTLPDYVVTGNAAIYANQSVRPYSVMEKVDVFTLDGGGPICDDMAYSYTVNFSEKEAVLQYPGDMDMAMYSAWDSPYQRIADRNMPWVELKNNSDSDSDISQFMITIGDPAYHFSNAFLGDFIKLSDSITLDGFSLMSSVSNNGDKLTIDFVGGVLKPGETIRFKIDIDPDDPNAFPHPDFRTVMFDMNGNSTADNSVVTVQNLVICDPQNVPEPATISLLGIGAALFGLVAWRRRRRA